MMHDAKEVARMLADRVEEVCRHLVPGGKRTGGEWECDSVAGGKGRSLKVRLTGDKAGVWADFSNGTDKGDLLDLWAAARCVPLGEAIKEAKAWLGIAEPRYEPPRKVYSKPKNAVPIIESRVTGYLKKQRLLLTPTINAFKIGSAKNDTFIAFPYYSPSGELVQIKQIGLERGEGGKKVVFTEKDCAPALFGWHAFKGGRTVCITEGEIDAMTMHQYGFPALSIPFGAGGGNKNDWIDFEWDNLAQFETIYLCYDNDPAGQAAVEEVARRLGIYRCRWVKLIFKDANECLQKGVSDEEIKQCLDEAKTFDPPEIRSAADFRERVIDYFYPSEDAVWKVFSPKIFQKKINFRPGELTVWTGCNSHGKSVMIGQIMMAAAVVGFKVAIASMEMKPEQTLGRMLRQYWATKLPDKAEIEEALAWMSDKIWIYDLVGNVPTKRLMELMEFSVRRHGVSHFVIDSLMKCDVGVDDYDGQRKFLNEAVTFGMNNNCHIHLVAHPRKHDEERPIGRVAVSGSGDISNQAHNVVSVWRNKAKERNEKTWTDRDAVVLCDKQRETGWEGYIELEFSKPTEQYLEPGKAPTHYFEWVRNAAKAKAEEAAAQEPTGKSWDLNANDQPTDEPPIDHYDR